MGAFPVKRLFLGFSGSSLFGAGKAVLRPVACDQVPGARGRGQGTETLARYAIPFFLGPNHDVVVQPVPTCIGPDNPPHYEPTTYGDFTERLLILNFAHRRAESSAAG
jgi:hypothetical protein